MNQLKAALEKYKSLSAPVKASFWVLMCSLFQSAFSLLTTPVFTRTLSQAEYGIYGQYGSWLGILGIVITMNLNYETYVKGLADHQSDEAAFTSSMLGLNITIFSGFLLLFLLAPSFWADLLHLSPLLIGLIFVHLFVSLPFDYFKSREEFHFRYKLSTLLSVLVTVFSYGFSIYAVLHFSNRLEAKIEADLLVRCLAGLPILIVFLKNGKKLYDRAVWKYSLAFALPLVPHYLSNIVLTSSDRLMIGRMAGDAEAGIYSIAYMIASMVLMLVNAINSSFVPYTFQRLKEENYSSVNEASRLLYLGVALLCIGAMGVAPEVIRIFAGKNYGDASVIVPSVSASVFFIFVFTLFTNVEYHYKKTKWIGAATLAAACLNVFLNWVLIPVFGYTVAGTTTLLSYLFLAVFHYISYRTIQKEEQFAAIYDIGWIVKLSLALLAATMAIHLLYRYIILRYILVAVSVGLSGYLILQFRKNS